MMDSDADKKNIDMVRKGLLGLRHALDVYCLISVNASAIKERRVGQHFFGFVQRSCVHLITLDICKVFDNECDKNGNLKYELNSIDGIIRGLAGKSAKVLNQSQISDFVRKYGDGQQVSQRENGTLNALELTVRHFRAKYNEDLQRFRTVRNKLIAHNEFGFDADSLPSYDVMEQLFCFAWEFYSVISECFIGVGPVRLESHREVRGSMKRMLSELGIEDIKTEMK
jgi:hypothetical protein